MLTDLEQVQSFRILETARDRVNTGLLLDPLKNLTCLTCRSTSIRVELLTETTAVVTQGAIPIIGDIQGRRSSITKVLGCAVCGSPHVGKGGV